MDVASKRCDCEAMIDECIMFSMLLDDGTGFLPVIVSGTIILT
jgi:hypothetical protein